MDSFRFLPDICGSRDAGSVRSVCETRDMLEQPRVRKSPPHHHYQPVGDVTSSK